MLPWLTSISYLVLASFRGCYLRWWVHERLPFWEPWSPATPSPDTCECSWHCKASPGQPHVFMSGWFGRAGSHSSIPYTTLTPYMDASHLDTLFAPSFTEITRTATCQIFSDKDFQQTLCSGFPHAFHPEARLWVWVGKKGVWKVLGILRVHQWYVYNKI